MNLRRILAWGFLAACGVALPGADASAQSIPGLGELQQADTTRRQAVPLRPQPIPLDQAPRRLEQDHGRLRSIGKNLVRFDENSRAWAELGRILEGVGAILDNFDALPLDELRASDLSDYRNSLQREQGRLTRRADNVERRFLELGSDERELDWMRLEWVLTRDSIGLDSVSAGSFEVGIDRVLALFPRLGERLGQLAGSLSGGEQQMLSIGRAMMSKPKLLLIDELSLGLMPQIIDLCYEAITALKINGLTILVVEQSTQRALEVADRVCVLESGKTVWQGTAEKARDNAGLIDTLLGLREEG